MWGTALFAILHDNFEAEAHCPAYVIITKNVCRSLRPDVICAIVHTSIHPHESLAPPGLIFIIVDGMQHDAMAVLVIMVVDKAARGCEGACFYSCHIE